MMRKLILLAFATVSPLAFGQWHANGVGVVVVGDGVASISGGAANQTAVRSYDRINTGQSGQNVVTFNSGAAGVRLTNGAGTVSEGSLSLSADGTAVNVIGYDAALGTASVGTTTSIANNRVVGSVDFSGNATLTSFNDAFSGAAARSVYGSVSGGFWMSGSSNGTRYGTSTTTTVISNTITNQRVINGFGGDLYFSSASAGLNGIGKIASSPTSGLTASTTLFSTVGTGTGTADPYGFYFANANTVYVGDNRAAANGGGIQKWSFNGSTWSLAYTLSVGTVGARYVTGEVDGFGNVTVYASTSEASNNRLVKIADIGASSTSVDLASAGTNKRFAGVSVVNVVPEPTSMIALGLGLAGLVAKKRRK